MSGFAQAARYRRVRQVLRGRSLQMCWLCYTLVQILNQVQFRMRLACFLWGFPRSHNPHSGSWWEENWDHMCSLWRTPRPCFQRGRLQGAYRWAPLRQQRFDQVCPCRFSPFPVSTPSAYQLLSVIWANGAMFSLSFLSLSWLCWKTRVKYLDHMC